MLLFYIFFKNPIKPKKKPMKPPKKTIKLKKPTGLVFFLKTHFFANPELPLHEQPIFLCECYSIILP